MTTNFSRLVLDTFRDLNESVLSMPALRAKVAASHHAALQSGIAFGVGEGWWDIDAEDLCLTVRGRIVVGAARSKAA